MNYFTAEGVNASSLKVLKQSPAHYLEYLTRPRKEPTPDMKFGTMAHKLILEPSDFKNEYVVAPQYCVDAKTKKQRELDNKQLKAWTDFVKSVPEGKEPVMFNDFQVVKAMKEALLKNPAAAKLLRQRGAVESERYWTDERTGLKCKAKIDKLVKGGIVDYKTARTAEPSAFVRDAINLGYHIQAGHYLFSGPEQDFYFIAQEKTPPYVSVVFKCDYSFIRYGQKVRDELMKQLVELEKTQEYYGYSRKGIERLELPSWLETEVYGDKEFSFNQSL